MSAAVKKAAQPLRISAEVPPLIDANLWAGKLSITTTAPSHN